MASALNGLLIAALVASLCQTAEATEPEPGQKDFSISSMPLSEAINAWARTTGISVLTETTPGTEALVPSLVGIYTSEAALELLLKGSPLGYCYVNRTVVVVIAKERLGSAGTCSSVLDFDSTSQPSH